MNKKQQSKKSMRQIFGGIFCAAVCMCLIWGNAIVASAAEVVDNLPLIINEPFTGEEISVDYSVDDSLFEGFLENDIDFFEEIKWVYTEKGSSEEIEIYDFIWDNGAPSLAISSEWAGGTIRIEILATNGVNYVSKTLPIPEVSKHETYEGLNYEFFIQEDHVEAKLVGTNTKFAGDVVIPQELKIYEIVYPVTAIKPELFKGNTEITKVTMPDTITTVSDPNAVTPLFVGCMNLVTVRLSNNLEMLGQEDFTGCFALREINIPSTWTKVPAYLFLSDLGLKKVTIPNSVKKIEKDAFDLGKYGELETVYYTGTEQEWNALISDENCATGNDQLKNANVEYIHFHVFGEMYETDETDHWIICEVENCDEINEKEAHTASDWIIDTPASETAEGSKHKECTVCHRVLETETIEKIKSFEYEEYTPGKLRIKAYNGTDKKVVIPEEVDGKTVSAIGEKAFFELDIEEVVIPGSVKNVENYAFYCCESLKKVTLNEGVECFGSAVFLGCTNLKTIDIPASLDDLGYGLMGSCIKEVRISPDNNCYETVENCVLDQDKTLIYYFGNAEIFTIPDGVVVIGTSAFTDSEVREVTIPSSVKEIYPYAFETCYSLERVHFSEGLETIGEGAFADTGLISVVLPNSLKTVEARCFSCTPLTNVDLGQIVSLGDSAFEYTLLKEIVIPATLTSFSWDAFLDCELKDIRVESNHPDYTSKDHFVLDKSGKCIVQIPSGVSGKIVVPSYVTSIGDFAYLGDKITSVECGEQVSKINYRPFGEVCAPVVIVKNRNCTFSEYDYLFAIDTVICGYAGSTAQKYAQAKGYYFIDLEAECEHIYVETGTKPATCEEIGEIYYACAICGEPAESDIIPAKGHIFGACRYMCFECLKIEPSQDSMARKVLELGKEANIVAKYHPYATNIEAGLRVNKTGEYTIDLSDLSTDAVVTVAVREKDRPSYLNPINVLYEFSPSTVSRKLTITVSEETNIFVIIEKYSDDVVDLTAKVKISYASHEHTGVLVKAVAATCTTNGLKAYYKCECGKYFTDAACKNLIRDLEAWKSGEGLVLKKGHTYPTTWTSDGTNHWHACTVCGKKKDSAAHTLKTTTTKATLTENGKKETKCSVCAKVTKTTKIYAAKTIKLSKTAYAYDGKAKKPTVTVKDSKDKAIATSNYSVKYDDGRKNVGKYNVKITFKGDYKGSKTLTFTINPKATTIKTVTPASKAFTATWSKQTTQVDGYELQYALDDKFTSSAKKVEVNKNTTTSKKISSLKSKKTYYVRVRTYKKVGTKKYYSDWSKVLSVKTK